MSSFGPERISSHRQNPNIIYFTPDTFNLNPDDSDLAPYFQELGLEVRLREYSFGERIGRLLQNPGREIIVTYHNLMSIRLPELLRHPEAVFTHQSRQHKTLV